MTKFSDRNMARMYEVCRRLAADPTSEFYYAGRPRRGASHRCAYWNGRDGKPCSLWPRNSLGYAAWAAGRDDRRKAGVAS